MKKYDVPAVLFTVLILICLYALPELSGQRRPLDSEEKVNREELGDSVAKKADTTTTNELTAAIDSINPNVSDNATAISTNATDITNLETGVDSMNPNINAKLDSSNFKAGANVTIGYDGTDLTIASTGGGGGDGWSPVDSTFSLNLSRYFNLSVVQFMAASHDDSTDYSNWANWGHGVITNNTTAGEFLTDWQSMKITIPTGGTLDGGFLDIKNHNFFYWLSGDTCTTANYLLISINITDAYIDSLGASNLQFIFGQDLPAGTVTNCFYYTITPGSLSDGWNHIKLTMSSASEAGTGDWSAVKWIGLRNDSGATDGEVVLSFDYIAKVRKDPNNAFPSAFQTETADGTWTTDWYNYGGGQNTWIVQESGQLSLMTPDGTSSYLRRVTNGLDMLYFGDFTVTGVDRVGASGQVTLFYGTTTYHARTSSTALRLQDSLGVYHQQTTTFAEGEIVHWKYARNGTSHTIEVSKDYGATYPLVLTTFCMPTVTGIQKYIMAGQRSFSFGGGKVTYAEQAGMAYTVEYLLFRNDTLFVKHAGTTKDSLAAFVPAVILKE